MALAEYMAFRVIEKKIQFARVPKALQDQVQAILTDLGFEDLAK